MDSKEYWSTLVRECDEEFLRLCEESERNIYDYIVPMLLEEQSPEQRDQFYHGLDWGQLKQTAPYLWQKYSQDALNIQSRAAKKEIMPGPDALDHLRDQEREEGYKFQLQIQPPKVFGLKTGAFRDTGSVGLNTPIPMGQFGG